MAQLSPDQRNYYYLIAAARTGIHKPILAALYAVQSRPMLTDGETGLGIAPANRIPPDQVNTFPEQVQYAANTIRSLTDQLIAGGWQGVDLWDAAAGRYADRLLQAIAEGYSPAINDSAAARLEPVDAEQLQQAYINDTAADYSAVQLPQNLAELDKTLLSFVDRIPANYSRLDFQREALLEAVRLWRKLDTQTAAIASLGLDTAAEPIDETALDRALVNFISSQSDRYFSGYPNQREALIRLVQLWRELDSREAAIEALSAKDPFAKETNLAIIDPALVAFAQRVPANYQGRGDQRFALIEGYRLWHELDSRTTAIQQLGIDPQALKAQSNDAAAIAQLAANLDRALLDFWMTVPTLYTGADSQREALLRLVTLWRRMEGRTPAIQSLFNDLRQMARANPTSLDAMPQPQPTVPPRRPPHWTPRNLQLNAAIRPGGNFTWAEATRGGTHLPPDQQTVEAIVRIAELAQQARDRIGRPFIITSWYRPSEGNARAGGASLSRYTVGDAIDFYCDGLTGLQLYWALDPWWPGGLGRYTQFPYLCHLDARSTRARWVY
ncbi:MAG: D-Ala-D-Ala carboxypeptidase family metallohydrolase [Cyanobacteria bacterium P01_C01_bin.120]